MLCASCCAFVLLFRKTKLLTTVSPLGLDGDDDAKRNNKCWLIWEVSVHKILYNLNIDIFLIVLNSNGSSWISRAQLKSATLRGRWSSSSARQRTWPGNTSRNTAQNSTGISLSARVCWTAQTTETSITEPEPSTSPWPHSWSALTADRLPSNEDIQT